MNDLAKKHKNYRFLEQILKNSLFLANFCLLRWPSGTRGLEFRARA